jgi:Fuc2NAc and GlcNAc transferase
MTSGMILVVLMAFVVAVIGTGLMRRYALHRNLVDVPNMRSSHASPTPRGGGAAVVLAFFASLWLLACVGLVDYRVLSALLIGGSMIALVGFIDDRWHLRASVRLGVHLAAAIWVVIVLGGIPERALANWGLHGVWIGGMAALLTLIWATNLFNFMDGIDGIAGSEAVFVSGAGALLNWHQGGAPGMTAAMLCLAGACLGFLRWNWPPASIFMGDVGSGFLGFTLAVLGLASTQHDTVPIEVWAILSGVFLVDATVTLLRRIARGDRWFEAHRLHAYQCLASRWQAHSPVTCLVITINMFWLLPLAWIAAIRPACAMLCLAVALAPLALIAFLLGAGRNRAKS